jgi:trans-aconitate methyltransferase
MAQVSRGVRKILEVPWIYSFFQKSVEKRPIWSDILEQQVGLVRESMRVLDIGCGPGTFLTMLNDRMDAANFWGLDPSPEYIRRASELFPGASFLCGTVATVALPKKTFDLVVVSGVLHHVDDDEAMEIMRFAHAHKSDEGIIITVDPVFFPGQNFFAKWMALADRGQNVRTVKSLEQLWLRALPASNVQISIKSGYLRVPYNHVVCTVAV